MNSPVSLRVSPASSTPKFFQSEALRFYFPMLEPWVEQSVSLPSCSSCFIHTQTPDHPLYQDTTSHTLFLQPLPCCLFSPAHLPISTSPTILDECFFFNSLVVRLSCSLIFWHFWLFYVFKFVVLFVVWGSKVYVPMPPSWLEVKIFSLVLVFLKSISLLSSKLNSSYFILLKFC